ncbi:MAG: methyltransferase [Planctomycetes bacterium]|nr:methyltransferase [Planctomycetota bacterium]
MAQQNAGDPQQAGPAEFLFHLLGGKARAQAVSTVAALGVADRMIAGPRRLDDLAAELGVPLALLQPLLRMCAGLGMFHSPEPGSYALTERGACLRSDRLGPFAAFAGSREQWEPWGRLRECATGEVAFERAFGTGMYPHLAAHPEAAALYDAAIDAFTAHEAAVLCERFDFSAFRHVVDVGGGRGALLAAILTRWQHLQGTLFDLPHVAAAAAEPLRRRCGDRAVATGGDFFIAVPEGADAHLVKHVVHNWDDARAKLLLRRCLANLAPGGRLLVVEFVLAPDDRPDLAATMDLEMLVLNGGRVRRRPELRRLLADAGLSIERMVDLGSGNWLFVAKPGSTTAA